MANECCDTDEKDLPKKGVANQPGKKDGQNHSEDDGHNHGEEDTAG